MLAAINMDTHKGIERCPIVVVYKTSVASEGSRWNVVSGFNLGRRELLCRCAKSRYCHDHGHNSECGESH